MNFNDIENIIIPEGAVGIIKKDDTVLWESNRNIPYYIENISEEEANVNYHHFNQTSFSFKYKIDNGEWVDFSVGGSSTSATTTNITKLPPHSRIYIKGKVMTDTTTYTTSGSSIGDRLNYFICYKPYNVGGNIMSCTTDEDDYNILDNFPSHSFARYGFQGWFLNSTHLKSCEKLYIPIVNLTGGSAASPLEFFLYNSGVEVGPEIKYSSVYSYLCYKCPNLQYITINVEYPPTLGFSDFEQCSSDFIIYVPDDSIELYQTAARWTKWATHFKGISEKQ